jgi:trk system potassium uptake protein TrkA
VKVVIVGAGQVGFHIASHLALEKKNVVVIDRDKSALRRVSDSIDVQTVQGSGSSPLVLEKAGIKEAEIVLAVTNSDETNLVACLVANILSPATKKLARIRGSDFDRYHQHFHDEAPHIDTLINPEIEVVKTIDQLMSVPGAVDVGEFAGGKVKFVGVYLEAQSRLCGVRLADLPALLGEDRPLIAAILREEQLIIPQGSDTLEAGDLVYFIAEENKLDRALEPFDKETATVRRVMVVGGGRIGLRVARLLESRSIHTKIVEKSAERCAFLAEQLNKTIVLHGDGSDQELLIEENIREMDVVLTLTDDEETNILASLLAKRMGAHKAITKISKFSYFPLMKAIGLEQVVSPRLSAINSILQHIRRGKVLSAISIKGEQAEVIEAVAMETSDIVGKPLKNVALPKGVLVTGIIRDDQVIIPSGESVILPDDRVIIFARRQAIPKIEKILAVKLEYF